MKTIEIQAEWFKKLDSESQESFRYINDLFYKNWGTFDNEKLSLLKNREYFCLSLKAMRKDFLDRIGLIVNAIRKTEYLLQDIETQKEEE